MTREEETETLLGNRGETPGAFSPGTVEEQSAEEALSGIIDETGSQQAWRRCIQTKSMGGGDE